MVKIKQKKRLALPQLIEWAWDNGIDSKTFTSPKGGEISFDEYGDVVDVYSIEPTELFPVEVEEEITEDTVIPKALNVFKNTTNRIRNDEESHIRRNVSVKEIKENSKDYIENDRLYIMNDDLTLTLIWTREKGMV